MSQIAELVLDIQKSWAQPGQPQPLFEAVGAALAKVAGHRLYTATQMLKGGREVERLYSTNPDVYPVGGRKAVLPNAFNERVRKQQQPFLGRQVADFAPYFPDHETIAGLGLGSVINLPVVYGGHVLGTVNILDRPGAYDTHHLEPAMIIARQLLPAFITADS